MLDEEAYKKKGLSYIDETNNSGNFNIKKGCFNTDNTYFLRGGIFIPTKNPHSFENNIEKNIECLFEKFDKKTRDKFKNQDEVKYKGLLSNNKSTFLDILSIPNIQEIIHWLYMNKYLIHYGVIDNLFYSISDILEPLIMSSNDVVYPKNKADFFKSTVTEIAYNHQKEFVNLAKKYNVPNVVRERLVNFYKEFKVFIIGHIGEIPDKLPIAYTKEFVDKAVDYDSASILLSGNKEDVLIDKYVEEYTVWVSSFPSSYYIIDKQDAIERSFKNLNIPESLAVFEDSKQNSGLQLADYIVNILKTYIDFLNNYETSDLLKIVQEEKNNPTLIEFATILHRSREYSPLLNISVMSRFLLKKMQFFENILIDKSECVK
ncbi:DUF3800 domain-containing protein [Pediococcus damnosus]|nr:DUF3800 domain-containing protein [Pediococcus damnosus]